VLREIQLRFCSQPQPLWVVAHKGYKVPYQLHCWPPVLLLLDDAGALELAGTLLVTLDAAEELVTAPEQTAPLTVGVSAEPPFLLTWKPKETVCPGAMLPFQPREVAVYGLLPLRLAFHELVIRLVLYCQLTLQPLIALESVLLIEIVPV
jgi:hypothetical protein